MGEVLPYVVAVEHHVKLPQLQDTIKELLFLVEDASRFVIEYKSDGAAVRAVRGFVSSNARDQVDRLVDRFGRLKEAFDRGIAAQVVQRVETLLGNADWNLLEKLIVPAASYDLGRSCLEGTRVEILDDIRSWALTLADSTTFFWLYGPAGCGKSAVSTSVSDILHGSGTLGASFFCKRDNEHLRKPENVISHLAASLGYRYPQYGAKIAEALRNEPELAHSSTMTRFAGLIVNPLQSIGQSTAADTLTVVVDAIDECGTASSRGDLIDCLLRMSSLASWLKVLVTSRPNEDVRDKLGSSGARIRRRDLFAEDEVNISRDIIAYVRGRMNAIPVEATGRDRWPQEQEIIQRSQRSNKLFIWARTACNLIQQSLDPGATLAQILAGQRSESAKETLGTIYTTALNEALGEAKDDAKTIQLCVGAIVLTGSRRPLPDAALAALLSKHVKPHVLSRVISRLGSVLYRDDQTAVRVLHQSFSDYMTEEDCPEVYRTDSVAQNASLAASCLEILLQGLRFNICRLLFKPHLLYWIKTLSLSKELHAIMDSMNQLMNWIKDSESNYARAAVEVYRFLTVAFVPISASAPHLYVSALAFGAANYETFRVLKSQFPNSLCVTKGFDLWNLPVNLCTIHVEGVVLCVSFSPDNQRVIAGSTDSKLRIWDAHAGTLLLEPLEGHRDSVTTVQVSPDGRRIVSGSEDMTVRVWDARTGTPLLKPLEGHTRAVTSIAVSADGRRIVSGSNDQTIRIWDTQTGVLLFEPLQPYSMRVTSVSISPGSQHIISGFWNKTVGVWDIETGAEVFGPLRAHSSCVSSVAIFPDGRRIVSGSYDKTIRIWSAHTGDLVLEPLQGHSDGVNSVAISSDGRRIVSGSVDTTIRIWDAQTGTALLEPLQGHSSSVNSVAISPDGQRIVSGSGDQTVRIWDAQAGTMPQKSLQGHSKFVNSVAISSDDKCIVSGSKDKTVRIWDRLTGAALVEPLQGHSDSVRSVAISSDGKRIVSGSDDDTIRIWDAQTGAALLTPLQGHSSSVTTVLISHDDRRIVSGSQDETIRVWDAETGVALFEPFRGHSDIVTSIAISCDNHCIISGSWDKTVRIWNSETGASLLQPLRGHTDSVECVTLSSDGRKIISGSRDGTVRIWDAQTGAALLSPLEGHIGIVNSVAISADGRYIVSGSGDYTVRIWDAQSGAEVRRPLRGHAGWVTSVAISSNGRYVASGSRDNTVRTWDIQADSPTGPGRVHAWSGLDSTETLPIWDAITGLGQLLPLKGHTDSVNSIAISSDNQYIVSGSNDLTIRIWDAKTGAAISSLPTGHSDDVSSVAISPDGQRIVSGSRDRTLRIWDARSGTMLLEPLDGHSGEVTSVAVSADGQRIISGSADSTIRVWDALTGTEIFEPLRGHSSKVTSVAISADGQFIISGFWDGTARIWNAQTGAALVEPLRGHTSIITSVAISQDGQYVVSGSHDNTMRVWDVQTGSTLLGPLRGHSDCVTSVVISPDSRHIVSASRDNTVRIWDAQTGATPFNPLRYSVGVSSVLFSPDGRRIMMGAGSMVLVWDSLPALSPLSIRELYRSPQRFVATILPNVAQNNRFIFITTSPARHLSSQVLSVELLNLLDSQGWICGPSGERMFWIPQGYVRHRFDQSLLAISTKAEDHPVAFDFSRARIGSDWLKIIEK
ncbi:hypothetical protein FRC07_013458 [Ceratobasidium sp. 392]|nr:hypothetical protein FRC07_013458 [Ceratobasidium sp. 392]